MRAHPRQDSHLSDRRRRRRRRRWCRSMPTAGHVHDAGYYAYIIRFLFYFILSVRHICARATSCRTDFRNPFVVPLTRFPFTQYNAIPSCEHNACVMRTAVSGDSTSRVISVFSSRFSRTKRFRKRKPSPSYDRVTLNNNAQYCYANGRHRIFFR